MPPQGMPRPDQATLESFTSCARDRARSRSAGQAESRAVRRSIASIAPNTRTPSAICSISKIDVTELLPADDESDGFDNIADVLEGVSVAAGAVSGGVAQGEQPGGWRSERQRRSARSIRVPPDLAQDDHIEGLPLGTRGGLLIRHNFPLDAEYQFSVKLLRNIVGYMTGLEWPHQLEITVDGERVFIAPVGGPEDNKMSDENMSAAADKIDERLTSPRADQGRAASRRRDVHQKDVGRVGRAAAAAHARSRPAEHERDSARRLRGHHGDRMKRQARETRRAAAGFLSAVPRTRAKRRPAPERFFRRWRAARIGGRSPMLRSTRSSSSIKTAGNDAGNFEAGIQNALRLILASPKFLFRAEPIPPRPRRARSIGLAISSWRRGCRSSSGAAFPTTSC